MISVESGAKGSLFNVCQMTGLLGQQHIKSKRLTGGILQGTIFDQGFVVGSFQSGLSHVCSITNQDMVEKPFLKTS